jgi:hypothetical protein
MYQGAEEIFALDNLTYNYSQKEIKKNSMG